MKEKLEIAQRLRNFAEKFGGPAGLSRELKITPQQMNDYLSGRRMPGNKMQNKLRDLGCDIVWLMYGEIHLENELNYRALILRKARELIPEDFAINDFLRSEGITKLDQLKEFLNLEKIFADAAMVMREKIAKYKIKNKK